ncbi:hypothetical protein LCGC14_1323900 [marine sediment metagenome]|uniref:Uncharacterized protein n=1 Tax=marine sediment metagenome TaxID=412755 RepID=A0A0F9MZI7_9ZZZZ
MTDHTKLNVEDDCYERLCDVEKEWYEKEIESLTRDKETLVTLLLLHHRRFEEEDAVWWNKEEREGFYENLFRKIFKKNGSIPFNMDDFDVDKESVDAAVAFMNACQDVKTALERKKENN